MMKPHLQRAISASTYYQICLLVDHEVRTPQQHQGGKAYPQPPSSSRHVIETVRRFLDFHRWDFDLRLHEDLRVLHGFRLQAFRSNFSSDN
nr:hypothetical protein Iba_scaffold33200CG0010 [Ipomoea batatas]GME10400.1 hypothetical protein Iba_scaffold10073CG0150 [Ipomoea batatas]